MPGSGRARMSPPRPAGSWPAYLWSHRLAVWVGLMVVALVVTGVVLSLGSSGTTNKYGTLPGWLPKSRVAVGRVVRASAAHPWLAVEGDSVLVTLAHGQVLVTAVGPQVPEIGKVPVPATSPVTFVVTFSHARGSVPIGAGSFVLEDEESRLHHPAVSAYGGGPFPPYAPDGRSLSISIHDVLPTGEGQLRWAPAGGKPIVSWDFDVEID